MNWIFILAAVFSLSACVLHSTKIEEAARVNALSVSNGFAKSFADIAKRESAKCVPSKELKWELKLTDKSSLVRQEVPGAKDAYGPYETFCFTADQDGLRNLDLQTTHQGGGMSKAFYVLPMVELFVGRDLRPFGLSKEFHFQQMPWSGDYATHLLFPVKKGETYFFVLAADNRRPDVSWTDYKNTGLGLGLQGVFPIRVYSSPFGVVKTSVTIPIGDDSKAGKK